MRDEISFLKKKERKEKKLNKKRAMAGWKLKTSNITETGAAQKLTISDTETSVGIVQFT